MTEKASIITKTEDFLVFIIPILNNFPKNQKFLLADKIENNLLGILDKLIEAYYKPKHAKREILENINIEIEKTRHLIKLSYHLKLIVFKMYEKISFWLNEIGKMNGAWLKTIAIR